MEDVLNMWKTRFRRLPEPTRYCYGKKKKKGGETLGNDVRILDNNCGTHLTIIKSYVL